MPTTTTNFGLTKPDLNQTGWGTAVNTNFDVIDTQIKTAATAASAASTTAGTASTAAAAATAAVAALVQTPQILASSTSMTLDFSVSKVKVITLTSNVTSTTATNGTDGMEITICVKTGAGGFGFVFPANFVNSYAISTANANNSPSLVLQQKWRYDLADNKWYLVTPLSF